MTKILCTLVLLFLGQGAFSSPLDLSDLSEASEYGLASTEKPETIVEGSEVEFAAGLQKDLHKIKIILNADFSIFCTTSLSTAEISGETRDIISNLTTAKIIYPFHSFP